MSNYNILNYRRELHQVPEFAFEEYKTSEYIKSEVKKLGFIPIEICKTGVAVYTDYGNSSTVAYRADMDALKISEETNCDFKSKHNGFMHACGHDGHMAILLGFLNYLSKSKEKYKKNVLAIFQPAEEYIGGAKKIVDTKIFKKYNVEAIYGLHIFPEFNEGTIACRAGELMSSSTEIDVTITGKSAHGAMPHTGVDTLLVASEFITQAQHLVSRKVSPMEKVVLTFGKINGGDARNIIAEKIKIEGTMRSFKTEVNNILTEGLLNIAKGLELTYGVTFDMDIRHLYPPVINEMSLYAEFRKTINTLCDFVELENPYMLAEDFSYYGTATKALFFFLGVKNEAKGFVHPLHSNMLNFDEKALELGVNIYIELLKKFKN